MNARSTGDQPAARAAAPTVAELDELANELEAAFTQVCGAEDPIEADAALGGTPVRLRFASRRLAAAITPAFHTLLPAASEPPPRSISLWGADDPGLIERWRERAQELAPGTRGAQIVNADYTVSQDPDSGSLTLADAGTGRAWFTLADEENLAWWEYGSPVRTALARLLNQPGRRFMHAGAVAVGERAALITGPGGAGKSTLALACVEAGLDYIGEDYVLLEAGRPPVAHMVYATAKLDERSLELLPSLREAATFKTPDAEKAVVDLAGARPHSLRESAAVSAIVLPRIGAGEGGAVLEPVPATRAVLALAPTSTFHDFDPEGAALALAAEVARAVPAYELRLGPDPAAGAAAVAELLEA